jgi:hypothetical protein
LKQYVQEALNEVTSSKPLAKRILRVPGLLDEIDEDRAIYPNGILGSLKESDFNSPKTRRIELFAHRDKDEVERKFGILRELFVAFSSEPKLLRLAGASSNVIEVHAINGKQTRNTIIQDKLILKLAEKERDEVSQSILYSEPTPDLFVSSHWLDNMKLDSGDRVVISNPREDYESPPPCLASNGIKQETKNLY